MTGHPQTNTVVPAENPTFAVANATWFLPIAKASLFGAAQGGVELIGSAFLPGFWPIVSKALEPVTERLKAKLGFDPAASMENAEKAATHLESDKDLQALVEQGLAEIIAPLRDGQIALNEGQEQVLLLLDRNQQTLDMLAQRLEITVESLTRGVSSSAGEDAFAGRVAARVLLEIDQREAAHAVQRQERNRRFKAHVSRTQARAVELLGERKFDRATDELQAGLELLEALIQEDPGDTHLTIQLGYFFKSMAQDFLRQGDISRGEEYNDHALEIFGHVVHRMPHTAKSVRDYTDALNGLGNIHYARRHYEAATNYYHLATTIDPLYCYSWHDLYGALYERARAGEEPDIAGMRQALDMTRLTGSGQPGLSADYLDGLHKRLNALETWTAGRGERKKASAPRRDGASATPASSTPSAGGPSLEAAREAIAAYPENLDAQLFAGQVFLERGHPEEALSAYEAALRLKSDSFEASSARGALLAGFDRLPEALDQINHALRLKPGHPVALYNRACVYSLLGDIETALQDLREAIRRYPPYRATAEADPHFAKLREDPTSEQRFQALVGDS